MAKPSLISPPYRGRIAPSPTGYLHRGHVATFMKAFERAREHEGTLIYREEDIDLQRCRDEYRVAVQEDLLSAGISWEEGPDQGGPFGPYRQSLRRDIYVDYLQKLLEQGLVYPSSFSRKEILEGVSHYSPISGEPIFPEQLRESSLQVKEVNTLLHCNWRLRVEKGEEISFLDKRLGKKTYVAGRDFSDFLVWRKDGGPSYELAVVVDDILMEITEVVRGEDLLLSTGRQVLLYRAFGSELPSFYHCPLIVDEDGRKLSKRDRLKLGRECISDEN